MLVAEFLKTVDISDPQLVYMLTAHKAPRGKSASFAPLLAQRAVDALVTRFIDPTMKDLCYSAYHADEADPAEIVADAQTLPFLAERRIIVVNRADHYATVSAAGPLLSYLESPNETTMLILVAGAVDRRTKLFKSAEKAGLLVECPEPKGAELLTEIRDMVEARHKLIDRDAAQAIAERCGQQFSDVVNAVTLVCNFVGGNERITESDVATACADVAEEEIWTLTDAIADSDGNKALHALRDILDLGKSEFEVLGAINWLLKSAYAVHTNQRIAPFLANKVRPLAQKLGRGKFPAAFHLCVETDILFRTTGVDDSLAIELLVVKLAAGGKQRKRSA
ncbi:MAG: DNA polymerase III subunit delta [bacterium]|nr:DNA polymerase III subunit delta [bacterium]